MHTEAVRRAVAARAVTQPTSAGSSHAAITPGPPATTSVSIGELNADNGAAARSNPAELATPPPIATVRSA